MIFRFLNSYTSFPFSCRFNKDHQDHECWPLDITHKAQIMVNFRVLVKQIDPTVDLFNELYSAEVISNNQLNDFLERTASKAARNRKLLSALLKRSESDYEVFLECLIKSGQGHVTHLLESMSGKF